MISPQEKGAESTRSHLPIVIWLALAAMLTTSGILADDSVDSDVIDVSSAAPEDESSFGASPVPGPPKTSDAGPSAIPVEVTTLEASPVKGVAEQAEARPNVETDQPASPAQTEAPDPHSGTSDTNTEMQPGSNAADRAAESGLEDTDEVGRIATVASDVETKGDLPVAENVDLSEPVAIDNESDTPIADTSSVPAEPSEAPSRMEVATDPESKPALILLGSEVAAGTSARLSWSPEQNFAGIDAPTPVLVVNGVSPGPVLCLTAAIHGDELNGIEIVRRVLYDLEPKKLSGAVIGVPIVNLQGFRRGSRYLPDRRDLNRFFPGNPRGSAAARIAHSFFNEVITHCDALVDIHTGSFHRTNLPQLRADLADPAVIQLTHGFGSTVVLQSAGAEGTLRRAAVNAGIPAVTLETGGPQRVQTKAVTHGAKGIQTLLNELGMVNKATIWGHREPVYYRSTWVRADQGGVLFSNVGLGARVRQHEVLGTITDPITNVQSEVRASVDGRVLGMALNQFVMPGFAAFHLGIEKPVDELAEPVQISQTSEQTVGGSPGGVSQNAVASPGAASQPELADEIHRSD